MSRSTSFLFLLTLLACSQPQQNPASKEESHASPPKNTASAVTPTSTNTKLETPKADPGRSIPDPFDSKAALDLIYQGAPGASWAKMDKDASGKPINPPQDVLHFQGTYPDFGETTLYVKATAQYPFAQKEKKRILLLMESAPVAGNDAHASSVTVGAAVFTLLGDRWQLDVAQKEIEQNGSFGVGQTGKLIQIGWNRYGIQLPSGYANQGLTTSTESLYDITESGFSPLLTNLTTHEDDSGNCSDDPKEREELMMLACYSYSAKLEFVPGKNPDYHDLKVTYTGTTVDEGTGNVTKMDKVVVYTIKDGKYQL